MENSPGVYALLLTMGQDHPIRIGRKGTFLFPAGYYLYLGSAQGPGGLASRLNRHCRQEKKHRWHIDYFRQSAILEQVWAFPTTERLECAWAVAAMALPNAKIPVPGLGSSDCRCPSHLIHYPIRPDPARFARTINLPISELLVLICRDGIVVEKEFASKYHYSKNRN
ncbi:MAG: GIY-YIG nuclease family protein [Anaerolineales bacterium]|nr:GIY-YIG nuclease family protein [Anaerolineales bacterium]